MFSMVFKAIHALFSGHLLYYSGQSSTSNNWAQNWCQDMKISIFYNISKYLMILFWSYGLKLLILLHSLLFLSTPKLFIRLLLFWKNMHTYHLLHLSVSHILGWDTKHLLAGFLPWRSWNYSNFPSFKKSTETSVTPNDVYVCLCVYVCVCVCVCVCIAFSYSYISFMQIRINKSLNICTF